MIVAPVIVAPNTDAANVVVKLSWTGGGEAVELVRNAAGVFGPHKIPLTADETTIRVTVANRGARPANAALESWPYEVRCKPVKSPPPAVALEVLTPHDFRPTLTEAFVVSTQKVVVKGIVKDPNRITAFEWKVGDRGWEAGRLEPDPLDPTAMSHTLTIDLSGVSEGRGQGQEPRRSSRGGVGAQRPRSIGRGRKV